MRSVLQRTIGKLLLKYAPAEIIVLMKFSVAQFNSKHGKPFPHKNIYLSKSPPEGAVLVLAPHPDDEAIGMGGALSVHLENRDEVTVLYMTNGRGAGNTNGELIDVRRREAESLGHSYRFRQIFWDVDDTCLTNDQETVSAMMKVLQDVKPATVYVPSFFDHHFDHFAANQILIDAIKKMPLKRTTIFGYEVWDNMPFPNYVLDISQYFDKKAAMLAHYKTPLKTTDFVRLCKYREALHYTLYIDSRLNETEGFAEVFYHFDSGTYRTLYEHYLHSLQQNRSLLPSHVLA